MLDEFNLIVNFQLDESIQQVYLRQMSSYSVCAKLAVSLIHVFLCLLLICVCNELTAFYD